MNTTVESESGGSVDHECCPRCGHSGTVAGCMCTSGEVSSSTLFLPRNLNFFQQGVGVDVHFRACLACGQVWSWLDPRRLRSCIEKQGLEIARQQLDEFDRGIYRDLPNTDLAREIAEKVAEIDVMVRNGQFGAVARYRELRGVTWDEAIKDTKNWIKLTRSQKLELFGWVPKKKTPLDDWF